MTIPPRILEVSIGPSGAAGRSWGRPTVPGQRPQYVEVDVTRQKGKKPNKCKVTIDNLSSESIAWIEKAENRIVIQAGQPIPVQLFSGRIHRRGVRTEVELPKASTVIEAGDGQFEYRAAKYHASYPPGADASQILLDVLRETGLGVSHIDPFPPTTYPAGYAFTGRVRDLLDELTSDLGATWSIQDGNVEILMEGNARPATAVVIAADTGMRGSPTRTDKGIKVVTSLLPLLRPNGIVNVVSRRVTGFYRVTSARHQANSYGTLWESTVEAVPMDA